MVISDSAKIKMLSSDYDGSIETCLIKGQLFKLKDTSLGFEPSNREYLREFPAYISDKENYQKELSSLKAVQSIFPLRCYSPSKSVFAMIHSKENSLLMKNTSAGFHIPYIRPEVLSTDPRIMLSIFQKQKPYLTFRTSCANSDINTAFTGGLLEQENLSNTELSFASTSNAWVSSSSQINMTPSTSSSNQQTQDAFEQNDLDEKFLMPPGENDPDAGYIFLAGPFLLPVPDRRKKEAEDPYVWVQYDVEKVTGCPHYWTGAFIVCPDCEQIYPCRICHDNLVSSHTLDRKRIKAMFCLTCNKVGRIGLQCEHCGAIVSRTFCSICNTLCMLGPEMKPTYHCQYCNSCHVGLQEMVKHCDVCQTCISREDYDTHVCDCGNMCPVCMIPFADNVMSEIVLPCNPAHKMHRRCFNDMILNENITCPLDHKIILDKYRYGIIKCENLRRYSETQLSLNQSESVRVRVYVCHDCQRVSADLFFHFISLQCHFCYSCNCRFLYTLDFMPSELTNEIEDLTLNDLANIKIDIQEKYIVEEREKARRHLLLYRKLYSDIVPTLVYLNSTMFGQSSDMVQIILNLIQAHASSH